MRTVVVCVLLVLSVCWSKEITKVEVLDGDTIAYMEDGKRVRVRLYGIDAPELEQIYGPEAKAKLKTLIRRKMELIVVNTDLYRREVGVLYAGGRCVNSQMILEGYAWHYPDTRPVCSLYKRHEEYARSKRIGMWQYPVNIEPWLYRKEQKK